MSEPIDEYVEPKNLTLLRRLVMTLMVVMIVGFVALIATLVMRLRSEPAELPLPSAITLPNGTTAETFTQGRDWFAVVTDDRRILIFDRATGKLRQTMNIER